MSTNTTITTITETPIITITLSAEQWGILGITFLIVILLPAILWFSWGLDNPDRGKRLKEQEEHGIRMSGMTLIEAFERAGVLEREEEKDDRRNN